MRRGHPLCGSAEAAKRQQCGLGSFQLVSRRQLRRLQPLRCAAEAQAQLLHLDDCSSGLGKLRYNKREQELPEELRGMLDALAEQAAAAAPGGGGSSGAGADGNLWRRTAMRLLQAAFAVGRHLTCVGPAGLKIQHGFVIDTKSDKVLNALDAPGSFEIAIKAARGDYEQPAGVEVCAHMVRHQLQQWRPAAAPRNSMPPLHVP